MTSVAKCIVLGDPPGLVSTAFAVAIAVLSMAAKWWPHLAWEFEQRGTPFLPQKPEALKRKVRGSAKRRVRKLMMCTYLHHNPADGDSMQVNANEQNSQTRLPKIQIKTWILVQLE